MHARAGFTLLEIMLAVAIGLMVLLIAVPSISGVMEQRRLHAAMESFDALVNKAHLQAVTQRKTTALVWKKGAIELVSLDKTSPSDDDTPAETLPVSAEQEYILDRPAALGEKPPGVWTFWRSGACEPVIVTYKGPEGSWKLEYDALTTRRTVLEENLR